MVSATVPRVSTGRKQWIVLLDGNESLSLSVAPFVRGEWEIKGVEGSFEFESAFHTEPSEDSCCLSKPYRSDGSAAEEQTPGEMESPDRIEGEQEIG